MKRWSGCSTLDLSCHHLMTGVKVLHYNCKSPFPIFTRAMKTPERWCTLPRCALFTSILAQKIYQSALQDTWLVFDRRKGGQVTMTILLLVGLRAKILSLSLSQADMGWCDERWHVEVRLNVTISCHMLWGPDRSYLTSAASVETQLRNMVT